MQTVLTFWGSGFLSDAASPFSKQPSWTMNFPKSFVVEVTWASEWWPWEIETNWIEKDHLMLTNSTGSTNYLAFITSRSCSHAEPWVAQQNISTLQTNYSATLFPGSLFERPWERGCLLSRLKTVERNPNFPTSVDLSYWTIWLNFFVGWPWVIYADQLNSKDSSNIETLTEWIYR